MSYSDVRNQCSVMVNYQSEWINCIIMLVDFGNIAPESRRIVLANPQHLLLDHIWTIKNTCFH